MATGKKQAVSYITKDLTKTAEVAAAAGITLGSGAMPVSDLQRLQKTLSSLRTLEKAKIITPAERKQWQNELNTAIQAASEWILSTVDEIAPHLASADGFYLVAEQIHGIEEQTHSTINSDLPGPAKDKLRLVYIETMLSKYPRCFFALEHFAQEAKNVGSIREIDKENKDALKNAVWIPLSGGSIPFISSGCDAHRVLGLIYKYVHETDEAETDTLYHEGEPLLAVIEKGAGTATFFAPDTERVVNFRGEDGGKRQETRTYRGGHILAHLEKDGRFRAVQAVGRCREIVRQIADAGIFIRLDWVKAKELKPKSRDKDTYKLTRAFLGLLSSGLKYAQNEVSREQREQEGVAAKETTAREAARVKIADMKAKATVAPADWILRPTPGAIALFHLKPHPDPKVSGRWLKAFALKDGGGRIKKLFNHIAFSATWGDGENQGKLAVLDCLAGNEELFACCLNTFVDPGERFQNLTYPTGPIFRILYQIFFNHERKLNNKVRAVLEKHPEAENGATDGNGGGVATDMAGSTTDETQPTPATRDIKIPIFAAAAA